MGKSTVTLICFLVAATFDVCCGDLSIDETLVKSNNGFSSQLYQALKDKYPNLVISPMSLQISLAMLLEGANGTTANEISNALYHSGNNDIILQAYKDLLTSLKGSVLALAVKIFVENNLSLSVDFQSTLTNYFLSEVQKEDFQNNPDNAVVEINDWVKKTTNDKIQDLFVKGDLTSLTRLVLANAAYFNADWKNEFPQEKTVVADFQINLLNTVKVKLMETIGVFPYIHIPNLRVQVVEIPFNESDCRLAVILPDETDGLAKVENLLPAININKVLNSLLATKVKVNLPIFQLETSLNLNPVLQQLGIVQAFTTEADFSKIADVDLSISNVVQKAFIQVNEKGAQAAVSTGVTIGGLKIEVLPTVRCDHPFIFVVVKGDFIMYMGKMGKPEPLLDVAL